MYVSRTLVWSGTATLYKVRYRKVGDPTWIELTTPDTWIVLNNLLPNTTYEWQVAALCSPPDHFSSWVAGPNFTTTVALCAVPSDPVVSNITANSAYITWTPPVQFTSFSFEYRIQGNLTWIVVVRTVPNVLLSGLTPGTIYEYRINTLCVDGSTTAYTSTGNFTTLTNSCAVPTGFALTPISRDSVRVSWTNVNPHRIDIYWRIVNTDISYSYPWNQIQTPGGTSFYDLTGLALTPADTLQVYLVRVCKAAFDSQSSPTAILTYTPGSTCPLPSGPSVSNIGVNSATITSSVTPWPSGGIYIEHRLKNIIGGPLNPWIQTLTLSSPTVLTGLSPDTIYQVRARSWCGQDSYSSYTSIVEFTTSGKCPIPTIQIFNITDTSADILVTSPGAYGLEVDVPGFPTQTVYTPTFSQSLTGLTASTLYTIRAKTLCSETSISSQVNSTFTTLPGSSATCNIPNNLSAVVDNNTAQAVLSWGANGNPAGTTYNIEYGYIESDTFVLVGIGTSTVTNFTATRLRKGLTYAFRVSATCYYNELSVTTSFSPLWYFQMAGFRVFTAQNSWALTAIPTASAASMPDPGYLLFIKAQKTIGDGVSGVWAPYDQYIGDLGPAYLPTSRRTIAISNIYPNSSFVGDFVIDPDGRCYLEGDYSTSPGNSIITINIYGFYPT